MKRTLVFLYGTIAYLLGLASLTYWVGFMTNFDFMPKTVNTGEPTPLVTALLINFGLMLVFGIQHGIMARKSFKAWLTRFIPEAAERSTFVLASALCLILIMWQWRPMPITVWHFENIIVAGGLTAFFWLGWVLVFGGSFAINHFELFGLQQIYFNLRNKPFDGIQFKAPFIYKVIRHPMMLGVVLAIWATPLMTVSQLFFAITLSIYLVIGLYFEERDLVARYGERYTNYAEQVPQLVPGFGKKKQVEPAV